MAVSDSLFGRTISEPLNLHEKIERYVSSCTFGKKFDTYNFTQMNKTYIKEGK